MELTRLLALLFTFVLPAFSANSTFLNPILPGWHSDPSCVRVEETYFCITSTFIAFPGLPIYASTDLINWRLISHVWNRESQLPGMSWNTTGQMDGMYAATLRYYDGEFWVACEYLGIPGGLIGTIFRTTNPFEDDAWSDPLIFRPDEIDPDLFWDDDGTLWVATGGTVLQSLDVTTGELSQPPLSIWNGTGGVYPEGPHLYKKDGWYYLLIAEGGTELGHTVTIARARSITGPYQAYEGNPILTNRGTDEYFQTVGHADLFTDTNGNWWGVALATRSGPDWTHYPMGRETVLFAATWGEGEWPILQNVTGNNTGWELPPPNPNPPGKGPINDAPDDYALKTAQEALPKHWMHWRVPRERTFTTTNEGLEVVPSRNNLTGIPLSTKDVYLTGERGLAFVGRRQSHTLFNFSIDLDFEPEEIGQEAGITVFLTQMNHIDISVVLAPTICKGGREKVVPHFRANWMAATERAGRLNETDIGNLVPVPRGWTSPYTLHIQAESPYSYTLYASQGDGEKLEIDKASSQFVSGGSGPFTGSLVGVFSTCNGAGEGANCPDGPIPRFQNWKYAPVAQFFS